MPYKPLGARLLVEPIITTLTLEERARRAGFEIVLEQDNRPKPTIGKILQLGSDPLMNEELKIGDIVFFNWHSGHDVTLGGVIFRQLEHSEVTGVMSEEEFLKLSSPESSTDRGSSVNQPSNLSTL
jgi:co-chaperonin GroES (HSP10)